MNAIKVARRFIESNPEDESAQILARLVLALESEKSFELVTLYQLNYKSFQLAMDILKEWRLDRYYASKSKLFDLSLQVSELKE
jgi:flagellar biosynthesis/type III secretory pathway protein FliH